MKLYEITSMIRTVLDCMTEDQEATEAYQDTLEGLHMAFEEKADNVACYVKELLAEAEAIKAEEKKLAERRKQKEKQVESLKKYLQNEMHLAGMKKLETTRNVLSVKKNPPSVKIQDERLFIENYRNAHVVKMEVVETIDKVALKECLKAGEVFPGAELVSGESFCIK